MYNAFDPTIKEKWVAALRSGQYQQGTSHLKKLDPDTGTIKHCCLGVLCELYLAETKQGEWLAPTDGANVIVHYLNTNNYPEACEPTFEVMEWAKLDKSLHLAANPYVTVKNGEEYTLAELNDSGDYDFEEIANLIENQL